METVSFFTFLEEKITEILFQLFFLAVVAFLLIFYGVDTLFVVSLVILFISIQGLFQWCFQKTVQCRFESCLKKVVRHVVKDYQQGLKRRKDKEIPFCELPEIFVENFAVRDDYETDYTIFSVCGIDIRVLDDELAEALKKLPERKRNTLLMYYFLEMTESEIANLQKITQSGVFRNRHHALETMKKILKEKQ